MSYKDFMQIVKRFAKKANIDDIIIFNNDKDRGKYFARFSGGIRLSANSKSHGITVRWGDNHQAIISAKTVQGVKI